ncbi:host attachment protein [Methylomicrobium sp. Wu6]|uniref:host attachment protein n=1 Tax=Methylomicrobium sp. Wu6 TaxID=3107928 RepID=UPI002DD69AD0|nr:host attachment protein [Methylomicrobium sp. Wu6]MEC4750468.1 host attachment protein [Methylomicrobium sp. Wu6]
MMTTWVVVADHSRARFFQIDSSSAPLQEIDTLVHAEGRLHDREMTSDLPGRVKNPGGLGGHAFEQPTDPKKHEADVFATEIVHYLEYAHNTNRFNQLIVIAGPSILGLIRQHMPNHLNTHITLELNKNLADLSAADIRTHLPEFLP